MGALHQEDPARMLCLFPQSSIYRATQENRGKSLQEFSSFLLANGGERSSTLSDKRRAKERSGLASPSSADCWAIFVK